MIRVSPQAEAAVVTDAERAGFTLVTFDDSPLPPGEPLAPGDGFRLDATTRAAYVATLTDRIGLAPVSHVATTEPFHLATQLAGLDHATHGRAAWVVGTTGSAAALATVGRPALSPDALRQEVADVVELARRLWDSWEDDAVIKDVATGRYLDPDKVHHVDFEGATFSIKGPLITPRPPQGHLVVLAPEDFAGVVHPEIVLVSAPGLEELRDHARRARRNGAPLVFAELEVHLEDGGAVRAGRWAQTGGCATGAPPPVWPTCWACSPLMTIIVSGCPAEGGPGRTTEQGDLPATAEPAETGVMNISNRTVFIAGATSGIGLELARRFAAAGSTVVVGGRRTDLLDRLAAEGLATVPIDVTDPDSVGRARDTVLRDHPGLDTVVTMSGVMIPEDLRDPAHFDDAEKTIDTNLLGTIRVLDAFTPHLIGRGTGTIITVSSGIGFLPFPPMPTYAASKAGVHAYTEALRAQLAGTGVEVAELVPPAVATTPEDAERNPRALGLAEFVTEVLDLLREDPTPREILVKGVQMHRWAERDGTYDELVAQRSQALATLPGRR